jgi:glucosamine--fructose-6-phosphate aminotransferase (isomerizing)
MCTVIGAVSSGPDVVRDVLEGLQRGESRGYDSAGVAAVNGHIDRIRRIGKVKNLREAVENAFLEGTLAIGHTRWATHGPATEANAHPHVSHDSVVVVHNGIIENHEELRTELQKAGYIFTSETDTEVVAHLVHYYSPGHGLLRAVQLTVKRLRGAYALVICALQDSNRMIAVRYGSPLLVGIGDGANYVASEAITIIHKTRRFKYLNNGDIADVTPTSVTVYDHTGSVVDRETKLSTVDGSAAELGQYKHFMQKEISEQPKALLDTLAEVLKNGVSPELFGDTGGILSSITSVRFLACGTSSYAGRIAGQWLESIAKIPAHSEIASEYRYRDSIPNQDELVVTISQSGETADTFEALKHAKEIGHKHSLAICNVRESTIARESELVFYTKAGHEVGVASTKAFTTQLAALFILALVIAKAKNRLTKEQESEYLDMLRQIPGSVQNALDLESEIRVWATKFVNKEHALFLGRGTHHCVALEGALKLKEITYIHAEAYPAGELKHGPLALIDEHMPVVVIAPNDSLFDKIKSNISEVRSRGGQLFVLTDEGSTYQPSDGIEVIRLPRHDGVLSAIMHTIPVQLLAYHVAVLMGRDVDNPRNLAKSVTVE